MYCQYNSSVSNLLRWNMLVTNNYSREHTIHCQFYSIFPNDMCMLHASKIDLWCKSIVKTLHYF